MRCGSETGRMKEKYKVNVAIKAMPHIGKAKLLKLNNRAKSVGIKVAVADVMLANARRMTTSATTSVAIITEGGMCGIPSPPKVVVVSHVAAPVSSNAWPSETAADAIKTILPTLALLLSSFQLTTPIDRKSTRPN